MHNRTRHQFMLLLTLSFIYLVTPSCDLINGGKIDLIAGEEGVYSGIYSQGIEDSSFKPCIAEDEVWQITEIQDTASFYSGLREATSNPIYMELRGVPSKRGDYRGFFMSYDRKITVIEAVTVKDLEDKDC